jgi:imidazoleglycerol-phosphate dehydratase/histidinol-phosphatase
LVWETTFKREKIGNMPTEMFEHFFQSFCQNAKCNLNIKSEGKNEHHKIESIFKAFAKALKMACSKTNNFQIPSTKGSL